jgi:hypothetical protein
MQEETKEVALSTPKITNTVELHLNQNDLIDIAIQEKLAILSAQIKESDDAIKENMESQKELQQKLINDGVMKLKKADKGYSKFLESIKLLGMKWNDEETTHHRMQRYNGIDIGEYTTFDQNHVEDSKDPIRTLSRNKRVQRVVLQIPSQIYLDGSISDDHGFSLRYTGKYVDMPKSWQASFLKKVKPLIEEEIKLKKIHYDLLVEYLQHQYGEKRIKAQIMRKSLTKSAEGRGILKMLEDATKIKVIG